MGFVFQSDTQPSGAVFPHTVGKARAQAKVYAFFMQIAPRKKEKRIMATRIVVGAQWGDEGKGKMVDYLAQNADLIVR